MRRNILISHAVIGDCPDFAKGIITLCQNEFEAHKKKRELRKQFPSSFIRVVPAPNGVVTHPALHRLMKSKEKMQNIS